MTAICFYKCSGICLCLQIYMRTFKKKSKGQKGRRGGQREGEKRYCRGKPGFRDLGIPEISFATRRTQLLKTRGGSWNLRAGPELIYQSRA